MLRHGRPSIKQSFHYIPGDSALAVDLYRWVVYLLLHMYKMKNHTSYIAILFLLFIFFSSCTVNQKIALRRNGTGEVQVAMELHDVSRDYLLGLAEALGGDIAGEGQIFDVLSIRRGLISQGGLELLSIDSPEVDRLVIELEVSNIEDLFFAGPEGKDIAGVDPVITFQGAESSGGNARLSFFLSRENFSLLSRRISIPESPMAMLLPEKEADFFPEDDYLELLDYAFGEYARETSVDEIMESSTIRVEVEVDGTVTSQSGGVIRGNKVIYEFPILRILTLEEPIRLNLEFR